MPLHTKFILFYHTVRHLKVTQVWWRIWYRFARPKVRILTTPKVRSGEGVWTRPAQRRPSLTGEDTFLFLNQERKLVDVGWDGNQCDKLWRYNQHYFDDLNAAGCEKRASAHVRLIKRWVADNKVGIGPGWEAYPTSLRIVNWLKWHLSGGTLSESAIHSIAMQARWLACRTERHLLGNHLFVNGKALTFAGLFFRGEEATRWRLSGLNIIRSELPEQVLADGGNFEGSPMYHALFLEDLLDLINISQKYPGMMNEVDIASCRATSAKMVSWLQLMCHPDEEISFFNDAAMGIAPEPTCVVDYAKRLGIDVASTSKSTKRYLVTHMKDSGYIRVAAKETCALLDVAPIGPDYLPGHAHADSLSFELSLFGSRVFVNSGTSQYGNGSVRQEERGTPAHNTVTINDKNSSEVWAGFRVARRAYPEGLKILQDEGNVNIECAHTGYARLFGGATHMRKWHFSDKTMMIMDTVSGQVQSAVAHFHIHPEVEVIDNGDNSYGLILRKPKRRVNFRVLNGEPEIEPSYFAPEFGLRKQNQRIVVRAERNRIIVVKISWGCDATEN